MPNDSNDGSTPPGLSLATDRADGRVAVTIDGELDALTAPELDQLATQLIADAAVTEIVFDLAATRFIDSSGLRTFVTTRTNCAARNIAFVLRSPTEAVLRLLDITSLTGEFRIE